MFTYNISDLHNGKLPIASYIVEDALAQGGLEITVNKTGVKYVLPIETLEEAVHPDFKFKTKKTWPMTDGSGEYHVCYFKTPRPMKVEAVTTKVDAKETIDDIILKLKDLQQQLT